MIRSLSMILECVDAVLFTSATNKKPSYTWQGAVLLDPGVPSYKTFLVEQAQRHFELLGREFHGIAIDRTDHTSKFSETRDDGVAWCGVPCASMLPAWVDASAAVSHFTCKPHSLGCTRAAFCWF